MMQHITLGNESCRQYTSLSHSNHISNITFMQINTPGLNRIVMVFLANLFVRPPHSSRSIYISHTHHAPFAFSDIITAQQRNPKTPEARICSRGFGKKNAQKRSAQGEKKTLQKTQSRSGRKICRLKKKRDHRLDECLVFLVLRSEELALPVSSLASAFHASASRIKTYSNWCSRYNNSCSR